jgi:hypothetical protein
LEHFKAIQKILSPFYCRQPALSPSIAVRAGTPRISRFNDDQKGVADMKYAGLCAIGIIVSVGPLAVGQGYAGENQAKCSLETLNGQYLVAGNGMPIPPVPLFSIPAGTLPLVTAAACYSIYNGNGTGTDYVTFTVNGINANVTSPPPRLTLSNQESKTVLPDGLHFNIYVAFDGGGVTAVGPIPVSRFRNLTNGRGRSAHGAGRSPLALSLLKTSFAML